jgi:MFS family permease
MSQFTIAMGQWMDQVARGWLLYQITGSPLQLGLVSVVRIFPLLFLAPIAGTMADRYGRKTQMIVAEVINGVANLLLGVLILQGQIEAWHVYATGIVASTVQVFQLPARQAMVPESVDRAHLTNAIGLNAIAFNVSRMLGPTAAGAMIAWIGPGGSYITQGLIFFASSWWVLQLRLPNKPPMARRTGGRFEESFFQSTIDGWRYVVRHLTIRTAFIISFVISFFGFSATTLLPVFASDILQAGSTGLGLLLGAMGVGAVISAIFVATIGDTLPKGLIIVGGVTIYGIGVLGFAASTWLLVSVALMVVLGICNVASNTVIQTVLQGDSEPEMRGRVMGAYQQHQVLIALGSLVAGIVAELWGSQLTMGIYGAACALGALAVLVLFPHIRSIR